MYGSHLPVMRLESDTSKVLRSMMQKESRVIPRNYFVVAPIGARWTGHLLTSNLPQVYASPLKSFLACDEREDVIVLMNQDHAFKFDFSDVSSPSLTFTTEMGNWQKQQPKAHGDFHPFSRYHAENSRKRIMSVNLRPRSVEDLFAMLERSEVESVSFHGSDTLCTLENVP